MPPTKYYKRPIPAEIQGVVVDGKRLGSTLYVPLRNGMTVADAAAYRELLISRAHQLVNFRLTEVHGARAGAIVRSWQAPEGMAILGSIARPLCWAAPSRSIAASTP